MVNIFEPREQYFAIFGESCSLQPSFPSTLKWNFRLSNENWWAVRIFNAEETCFVTSALKLLTCFSARAAHCINLAMPNPTELPRMRRSDIIPARPMTAAGDRGPDAGHPKMSAAGQGDRGRCIAGAEVSLVPI